MNLNVVEVHDGVMLADEVTIVGLVTCSVICTVAVGIVVVVDVVDAIFNSS